MYNVNFVGLVPTDWNGDVVHIISLNHDYIAVEDDNKCPLCYRWPVFAYWLGYIQQIIKLPEFPLFFTDTDSGVPD